MTVAEFILQELAHRQPETILALDALAGKWARFHLTNHAGRLVETGSAQVVSLALIGNALDNLQKPDALTLLGGLIRLAPFVLVAAKENQPLDFNDYLSLGMQRWHGPDESGVVVYGFDLYTYKTVPDWLNSKYWAHPELWKP